MLFLLSVIKHIMQKVISDLTGENDDESSSSDEELQDLSLRVQTT